MVHALEEIERVPRSAGVLLDLRPVGARWPVEVLLDGVARLAGRMDDSAKTKDDLAADQAVELVVSNGLLDLIEADSFEYEYFWDTPEQMAEFVGENWSSSANLPAEVVDEAKRLADDSADSKTRVRRRMIINSYRTQEGQPGDQ